MKLPFRQGLVRYQTDIAHTPTFLKKISGGSAIELVVSPDPTIYTIAHHGSDYLFDERFTVSPAWTGFTAGQDYWLYIDIDQVTGARTFGYTTVAPVSGPTQPSPAVNKHWFNTADPSMNVFISGTWQEKLRIFLAQYQSGSVLIPYPIGTQVGLNTKCFAGYVLFDDEERPVRKMTRGRRSEFITTDSVLHASVSGTITSFTFDTSFNVCEAVEPIPEYSVVTIKGPNQIGLGSYAASTPIIGIVTEDFTVGEIGSYVTRGFITNENWDFSDATPGTSVFCGITGEVTTTVPPAGYLQRVGRIHDAKTIFVDIGHQVKI